MCRAISSTPRDWRLFKAVREEAYKQLPTDWAHSKLAAVALRCPRGGRWYGFFSRTMLFGAISAVIHYNTLSRIISEIVCKTIGVPVLRYFEDFASLLPDSLAAQGIQLFSPWCELLGISLKPKNPKSVTTSLSLD